MDKVLGTVEFETFLEKVREVTGNDIEVNPGRRYVRLVQKSGVQSFAYGFVDVTNGDVLKSASWKAPAKYARGNIFNDDNGVGALGPYGVVYLR